MPCCSTASARTTKNVRGCVSVRSPTRTPRNGRRKKSNSRLAWQAPWWLTPSVACMNYFDFTLLGVLLVFIAIGAWRGFVREILSLMTWAAGGFFRRAVAGGLPRLLLGRL